VGVADMRQGTISLLAGCHAPIPHGILVAMAWREIHGRWPTWREAVVILLHDIGHWGLDYLDDPAVKAHHWELGAALCRAILGEQSYRLAAGHCPVQSGCQESALYRPDKRSWALAPRWWLVLNALAEPKLRAPGVSLKSHVDTFKNAVTRNTSSTGSWEDTHSIYLRMKAAKS